MLQRTILVLTLCVVACSSQAPPATPAPQPFTTATSKTDAPLLRLEDRREYDRDMLAGWASDLQPERRRRAAIAVARIGSATFEDLNDDGWRDENEPQAGTSILLTLTTDTDAGVRAAAAFALGETGDLRGSEALFALAKDENPTVCAEAAEAISKLVPQIPYRKYETLFSPDMPEATRRVAVRYLFRYGTEQASANAALLLDSPDVTLRREAAYSLSRHAIPQARRRIETILNETDALTRAYAARALGRIASPSSINALTAASSEPHAWVRTNSVRSLGSIVDTAGDEVTDDQIERIATLAERLMTDPDTGTATAAIEVVGRLASRHPPARKHLKRIAEAGSSWHRETAIHWLVRSFGVEAINGLSGLDDPWVKVRIVEGASASDAGRDVRARLAADDDPSVRAAAIANIPTSSALDERELIEAALDDEDAVVRAAAIAHVSEALPDDALTLLRAAEIRARDDVMNDARLAAIDALATHPPADQESWLPGLLRDEDPVVRRLAADQLETLKGKRPQFTPLPAARSMKEYEEIAAWAERPHIASLVLSRGELRIALRSDEAPMTAWNFASLAAEGYFNGTTFMRVVPNFVIQGGDPRNDMSGGPGYAIRDEMNMIKYERGAVGMALSGPDTGGSQFFVTHSPQPHLDGGYTVFGNAISGRGTILERIERGDRVLSITIKEGSWTQLEVDKVAGVPLPSVVGTLEPDTLMRIVPEYPERRESYHPDPDVVSYMASLVQPGDRVTVVLGTWCHDSQREVPRFLKILDELKRFGLEVPVRFIAVDREKEQPANMIEGLGIEMVATFIYFRNDEEIGRIVETPEGALEDHLLRIVSQ